MVDIYIKRADGYAWKTESENTDEAKLIIENEAIEIRNNCADHDLATVFPLYWCVADMANHVVFTGHANENGELEQEVSEPKKEIYYVTYRFEARYVVEVEARSVEEAKREAESKYLDADFGEATDIDGEIVIIENKYGDYVWEK